MIRVRVILLVTHAWVLLITIGELVFYSVKLMLLAFLRTNRCLVSFRMCFFLRSIDFYRWHV